MFLLDTSICIGLAKGDADLVARLGKINAADVVTCNIVSAELHFGARKSIRVDHNLAGLRTFLSSLRSLPFDERAAEYYGIIRADLEKMGKPIGPLDMLIAAIAMANDCTLVTRNRREFERIIGLRLVSWDA